VRDLLSFHSWALPQVMGMNCKRRLVLFLLRSTNLHRWVAANIYWLDRDVKLLICPLKL
jgi:hypothetical protein